MNAAPPPSVAIDPPILYVGTPVCLVGSWNVDGTPNLAPNSSVVALGNRLVLGLGALYQTLDNVRRDGRVSLSFPGPDLWERVAALSGTTSRSPPPRSDFQTVADKFAHAGLTPATDPGGGPPGVAECPIQVQAVVESVAAAAEGTLGFVILRRLSVRVHERLKVAGAQRIDPAEWTPLAYVFRHYVAADRSLGVDPRADDRRMRRVAA